MYVCMYVRMHDALRTPESIPIGVSCTFLDCVLPASCLLTGEMDGDVDVFSEAEYVYVCLFVCTCLVSNLLFSCFPG